MLHASLGSFLVNLEILAIMLGISRYVLFVVSYGRAFIPDANMVDYWSAITWYHVLVRGLLRGMSKNILGKS